MGRQMLDDEMADIKNLRIRYAPEGDLLALWNGVPDRGGGGNITKHTILTAFYAERGSRECVGFDLFDAAKMLMPFLKQEASEGPVCNGELSASYLKGTDTLVLISSECSIAFDQAVATGLTAHSEADGWAVGFTLDNAAELLLPHLETWRPRTAEEMAEIQKQVAEREAALRERIASRS
jgi:hypothetical protein